MVMMAPVVAAAIEARRRAGGPRAWTVLMSPTAGASITRARRRSSLRPRVLLVCGRYEGIDERVRDLGLFDEEISIGDFVLSGGEAAALVLVGVLSRALVPGVVGAPSRSRTSPSSGDRLDYPHYTRPREFRGARRPGSAPVGRPSRGSSAGAGRARSSGRGRGGRTCCERRPPSRGRGRGRLIPAKARKCPETGGLKPAPRFV